MAFTIFFLKKFEKVEKIGYHSNFNFECNTDRGFKESLSIALGKLVDHNGVKTSIKSQITVFLYMLIILVTRYKKKYPTTNSEL